MREIRKMLCIFSMQRKREKDGGKERPGVFSGKRMLGILLALTLGTLMLGAHPVAAYDSPLQLSRSSLSLNVGDTFRLGLSVAYPGQSVTWSSSKPSVVTVEDGLLTAKKAGSAVITVKSGMASATCQVKCKRTNARVGVYTYEYPQQGEKEGAVDTLYILERNAGKISFVCEHQEEERTVTTALIRVALVGNKTEVFSWRDDEGHEGTGRASFTGTRVILEMESLPLEEEDDLWSWSDQTLVMTLTERKLREEEKNALARRR